MIIDQASGVKLQANEKTDKMKSVEDRSVDRTIEEKMEEDTSPLSEPFHFSELSSTGGANGLTSQIANPEDVQNMGGAQSPTDEQANPKTSNHKDNQSGISANSRGGNKTLTSSPNKAAYIGTGALDGASLAPTSGGKEETTPFVDTLDRSKRKINVQ